MTKSEMLNHIADLSEDNRRMRECLKAIAGIENTVFSAGITTCERHAILLGEAIGRSCGCLNYKKNNKEIAPFGATL